MDGDYRPIDCSLHDRLESFATLRSTVRIEYEDEEGVAREVRDTIVDVFARGGAEYVRTRGGDTIRADRIRSVGGVRFDTDTAARPRARSARPRDEAGT